MKELKHHWEKGEAVKFTRDKRYFIDLNKWLRSLFKKRTKIMGGNLHRIKDSPKEG